MLLQFLCSCLSAEDGRNPARGEQGLTIQKTLVIDGEFGGIQGLSVDGSGTIYVADRMSHSIRVFSPEGKPTTFIGRRGRGPGEFTYLTDLTVARGDSLFALDIAQQRVSVFSLRGTPALAYTMDVSSREGGRASYALLVPRSGGVLVQYTTPLNEHNLNARREIVLCKLDGRGAAHADSLLVVPDREVLVTRDPQYGYSVGMLPFGRRSVLRLGDDDRLYYGWSDSLVIRSYSLDGTLLGRAAVRHQSHEVTNQDHEALLGSYETEFSRKLLLRAISAGQVPSTKPAFKDFLVDDRGRIWVNVVAEQDIQVSGDEGLRYTAAAGRSQDELSEWWVLDSEGSRVATVAFPHSVALHLVRGDEAYGINTDDLGVQTVVRYRITE